MNIAIKCITYVLLSLILLIVVITVRTILYYPSLQEPDSCPKVHEPIKGQQIIDRFVSSLRFKTITKGVQNYDKNELQKYIDFIFKSYPTIHSSPFVKHELVNNYSLLYSIRGSDPSLDPYLLCAHLDVVPVEDDKWDFDPFGGLIRDGFIYGRGTIDVKNMVMAILESFEYLLKNGFKPKRSFYIAFGHDEEGVGVDGAQHIAKVLESRGVNNLEYLLDEGMVIFNQSFPGVENLIAVVAVTEKGYLTVKLTAKGPVGHSSMAPKETSITTLAKAVSKFESTAHKNLFGSGPERHMIESIAPYASYPFKLVYSNFWLFSPILSRVFSSQPSTNGLVRTTSAVTIINGGFKENVLPSTATAIINHRIHPMQTIDEVVEYDRQLVNDDRITVEKQGLPISPHPISSYDSNAFGYQIIKRSIRQVFSGSVVIPGIMIASTDTRWYLHLTRAVYRFSPSVMYSEDTKRFHGHNERISVDNYIKTVNYYHHIIMNSNEKEIPDQPLVKDEL